MTATTSVSWTIAAIGSDTITAASGAADRAALLAGELDTLAVTIGTNHCGALIHPDPRRHGHINPDQITPELIDLHQAATAYELADRPTSPPA